jgi:hypothetical protein
MAAALGQQQTLDQSSALSNPGQLHSRTREPCSKRELPAQALAATGI